MSGINEKIRRIKTGFKAGGFEYLIEAFQSYFPNWLFFFGHRVLITAQDLEINARDYDGYITRFASPKDIKLIEDLHLFSRDKLLRRFERGDTCVVIVKENRIVSIGWAATGKIFIKNGGSIIDTGNDGVLIDGLYTVPEERLKGLFALCFRKQLDHYRGLNRNKVYGIIESLNKLSLKTHKRLGFEFSGETYYFIVTGISICYYKKWPQKNRRLHIFFKRPPQSLEWV